MNPKMAILKMLPRLDDPLPICGKLIVGRFKAFPAWNGYGPLPYPRWFILACRFESWVIITIIRMLLRKETERFLGDLRRNLDERSS